MSLCLSRYSQQHPEAILRGAAKAARGVAATEWELGAWLLAIERTRAHQSAGFRSTVAYAIVRLGLEPPKASNLLRIMAVLEQLPDLSRAFQSGEVGYAKMREITRVATPETELAWLEFARNHTTDQVRQRVVCSPAAFERRVRSVRNQADSLLSTHAQSKFLSGPPGMNAAAPELPGLPVIEASAGGSPDRAEGAKELQPGLFGPSSPPNAEVPGELPAGGSGQTRNRSESDGPGDDTPRLIGPGAEFAGGSSGSGGPVHDLVPGCGPLLEEDGLPAPQRVRLVVELSAEEYAEWGATVARISRQFGRRVSAREVILELARRHVACTDGSSLERNPVVVRLEPDGAGFVQTDRGPLAVSRQSSEDYLARANSVVVHGSQPAATSVVLLGGRRRKKLPAELVRSVLARAGGCCESCGQHGILHVHHIRALSRGGSNALENLRLLCSACHAREHASDFQPGSPWERARSRRQRLSAQSRNTQNSRGRHARPTGSDP